MQELVKVIQRVYGIPSSSATARTVEWATARLAADIGLEAANEQRKKLNVQRERMGMIPADDVDYVIQSN